jgi:spore germination cell wall hydrolase CwlJ-like protein
LGTKLALPTQLRRNYMQKITKTAVLAVAALGIFFLISTVTEHKFTKLIEEFDLLNPSVITAKERERQLDCLALNIYREAGNEPFEGKVGVAQVTLNRAEHPDFPKDVCSVVYQKTKFTEKVVCQFSWYCDSTHRNRPINKESYAESYEVAKRVLLEDFRLPSLEQALYYHADYVNPQWPLDRITKIGAHIFYKPRNT